METRDKAREQTREQTREQGDRRQGYPPTNRIHEERRKRFMSLAEFSEFTGVHHQTIWRAENGYPIKARTVRRLAHALGVEPSELAQL